MPIRLGDIETVLDLGDQLLRAFGAGRRDADCSDRATASTKRRASAWPVVCRLSSRAVAQSSSQVFSTPSSTNLWTRVATPSASKVRDRKPRRRNGSSTMSMPRAKNLLAEFLAQEAGLARDRAAVDGAGEMADQRAGDPAIEDDRHSAGRHLARIEALDRALAGVPPDRRRAVEIGGVQRRGEIVIAFPCRCRRRRSPTSRCRGASRSTRRESRCW